MWSDIIKYKHHENFQNLYHKVWLRKIKEFLSPNLQPDNTQSYKLKFHSPNPLYIY